MATDELQTKTGTPAWNFEFLRTSLEWQSQLATMLDRVKPLPAEGWPLAHSNKMSMISCAYSIFVTSLTIFCVAYVHGLNRGLRPNQHPFDP